jgi:hypothetical protein
MSSLFDRIGIALFRCGECTNKCCSIECVEANLKANGLDIKYVNRIKDLEVYCNHNTYSEMRMEIMKIIREENNHV